MTMHAHTNQALLDAYAGGSGSSGLYAQSFRNLKIDCASATQAIIRSGSAVVGDDGSAQILAGADKTLDITASGANGLDTGSEAANTWYYIYLIMKDDGTVNGLLSASATSPTLPSGYTKKRLVGAVRNNASSNFIQFKQVGNHVCNADGRSWNLLNGGSSGSFAAVDVSSYIPTSIASICVITMQVNTGYMILGFDGTNGIQSLWGLEESMVTLPHSSGNIYYLTSTGSAYINATGFILDL